MADKLDILLKGCKKGKPKSQEALYRRFASAMYGICLQYASCEEDAQDIMQEGFIKVFNKLDQVKNPAAFPRMDTKGDDQYGFGKVQEPGDPSEGR